MRMRKRWVLVICVSVALLGLLIFQQTVSRSYFRGLASHTWYQLLLHYGRQNEGRLPSGLAELERLGYVERTDKKEFKTSGKLRPHARRFWLYPDEFYICWSFSPEGHELVDGKIVKENSGEEVQLIRYRGHLPGVADTCRRDSRFLFEALRDIQRNQENVD